MKKQKLKLTILTIILLLPIFQFQTIESQHELIKLDQKQVCLSQNIIISNSQSIWPEQQKQLSKLSFSIFNQSLIRELTPSILIQLGIKEEKKGVISKLQFYSILIITIISIILLMLMCSCCQNFCIKKYRLFSRCCFIDLNKETKSIYEKIIFIFSILLVIGGLMSCLYLLLLNSDIQQGYKQLQCSLIQINMDLIQPQNNDYSWKGILHFMSSVKIAINQIPSALRNDKFQILADSNTTHLQSLQYYLVNNLTHIFNNHSHNKFISPLDSNKTLPSNYVANIGPLNNNNSHFGSIYSQLVVNQQNIDHLNNIYKQSGILRDSLYKTAFALGIKSQMLQQMIINATQQINLVSTYFSNQQKYLDLTLYVLKISQGFILLPVFFAIIGLFFTAICKIRCTAFFMHLAWFTGYLTLIFIFIISISILYLGIINQKTCEILTNIQLNPSILKPIINDERVIKAVEICLNYPQNLPEVLKLDSDLEQYLSINRSYEWINNEKINIEKTENELNIIKKEKDEVISATNSSVPQKVLEKVNQYSDYNSIGSKQIEGNCRVSQDRIVMKDCHNEFKSGYQEGNYKQGEERDKFGFKICYSFNNNISPFFTQLRYQKQYYQQCNINISQKLIKLIQGLQQYKQSVDKFYDSLSFDLQKIKIQQEQYNSELKQRNSEIISQKQYFQPLLDQFVGPKGLITQFNCQFIQKDYHFIQNSVCVTVINGLFYNYLFMTIIASLLFIFNLLMCFATTRLIPRQDEEILLFHNHNQEYELKHSNLF